MTTEPHKSERARRAGKLVEQLAVLSIRCKQVAILTEELQELIEEDLKGETP